METEGGTDGEENSEMKLSTPHITQSRTFYEAKKKKNTEPFNRKDFKTIHHHISSHYRRSTKFIFAFVYMSMEWHCHCHCYCYCNCHQQYQFVYVYVMFKAEWLPEFDSPIPWLQCFRRSFAKAIYELWFVKLKIAICKYSFILSNLKY